MTESDYEIKQYVVSNDQSGIRLDVFLSDIGNLCTRSQLKTRTDEITVNGKNAKLSRKLKSDDIIRLRYLEPPPLSLLPEKIKFSILYEDDSVIVCNKPQGLVVHPGAGNSSGTLVNGLLHYCGELSRSFEPNILRPGIVHRLDKDTSGVIITAKNPESLEFLSRQFRNRKTRKAYVALVWGKLPEKKGVLITAFYRDKKNRKKFACSLIDPARPFHGKIAETRYRVISEWDTASLVILHPHTGRTHQLRVHMQYFGCPIIGDPIYGRSAKKSKYRLMLHAWKLKIRLPGREIPQLFAAPVPIRFKRLIDLFTHNKK